MLLLQAVPSFLASVLVLREHATEGMFLDNIGHSWGVEACDLELFVRRDPFYVDG